MAEIEPTYIDYETFLDPAFSPTAFANTLVLATNNTSDTSLDLSTPLSRVLFDVQEVDTHIDGLTSKSALSILNHTKDNVRAGENILQELEEQVKTLTGSYERLANEVINRYEAAEEVRLAADRLWQTIRLGRAVGRCLSLGRLLEAQTVELKSLATQSSDKKEDHRVMVRAANTILSLRQIFTASGPGEEGEGLARITVVRTLRADLVEPSERALLSRAEQVVGQFSMSSLTTSNTDTSTATSSMSAPTYAQVEDTRSRATSALMTLYLISPVPQPIQNLSSFEPTLLINALQEYLRRAITSSLAGLTTALSALPRLDRTLLEVSARCQNIVALEMLLESTKPPTHPLLTISENVPLAAKEGGGPLIDTQSKAPPNLLRPLLHSLDTSSLPSYFWRSMASQLSARVQKIVRDGGVSARTLKSNRDRVRDSIRECVNRGSQLPASSLSRGKARTVSNWEREATVMVNSVVNVIGR